MSTAGEAGRGGAAARFGVLFGAGALGVLALVPTLAPQFAPQIEAMGEGAPPLPVLILLTLVQSLVLLAIAVAVGNALAPRLGIRSHLRAAVGPGGADWRGLRAEVPLAVSLGVVVALVLLTLDAITRPSLGAAGAAMSLLSGRTLTFTALGVLYGGITEELLMRWGLASLLAWPAWRLLDGPGRPPRAAVMWFAIVLAALLFGVGHLPAVQASGIGLTGPVVARTVALNAVGGMVFGWLYWRRSLESAMIAHATVHLTWSAVALVV